MSAEYYPDWWKVVCFETPDSGKVYKVLAGFGGGFTQGNSWQLSSGIESVEVTTECDGDKSKWYTMPQASGSVYVLKATREGYSSMTLNKYQSWLDKQETGHFKLSEVEIGELVNIFDAREPYEIF